MFEGFTITAEGVSSYALSVRLTGASAGGKPVLGPISLNMELGETLALSGPSGIGKSTLLRIIAGLHREYVGTIHTAHRVAFVFQDPTLLPWRSARDNITLTTGCDVPTAMHWLAKVGLSAQAEQFPTQMSLGQQRRLSLARAFAADPALLLMDEPFVSLDPALADEMMGLFETLRATTQVTTLLVTHSEIEAQRLGSRHLRLQGSPAQIA